MERRAPFPGLQRALLVETGFGSFAGKTGRIRARRRRQVEKASQGGGKRDRALAPRARWRLPKRFIRPAPRGSSPESRSGYSGRGDCPYYGLFGGGPFRSGYSRGRLSGAASMRSGVLRDAAQSAAASAARQG